MQQKELDLPHKFPDIHWFLPLLDNSRNVAYSNHTYHYGWLHA